MYSNSIYRNYITCVFKMITTSFNQHDIKQNYEPWKYSLNTHPFNHKFQSWNKNINDNIVFVNICIISNWKISTWWFLTGDDNGDSIHHLLGPLCHPINYWCPWFEQGTAFDNKCTFHYLNLFINITTQPSTYKLSGLWRQFCSQRVPSYGTHWYISAWTSR